ncbi:MAG: hypothetical protein R3B09_09050 [Nannocystaceae bacterium]
MGLKDAVAKFTEKVEDLTTLEVTTYTGSLEQAIDPQTGAINWSAFKPTQGALTMVAATRIAADFDTVNFRASGAAADDDLIRLHQAACESAQSGRLALIKMFSGALGLG